MINLKVIATGSTGNLFLLTDGGQSLLLETGLPIASIKKSLNYKLSDISGCLISHEHGDHAKGVSGLISSGVDVYMSQGTKEALGVSGHRVHAIEKDVVFTVGNFKVKAFEAVHDAADPVCYLIKSGTDLLLFAIDTLYIKHTIPGLTIIVAEVNHCEKILEENIQSGLYPEAIRSRVRYNHMSIKTFKGFLEANDLSRLRQIHMVHMSKINSDPDRFKREVQAMTGADVFVY